MGSPDFGALLESWWGDGWQGSAAAGIISSASNFAIGGNPAWGVSDFFAIYPKFAGQPVAFTGDLNGTTVISNVSSTTSLAVGVLISGAGIPGGTVIAAFTTNAVTLSQAATLTQTGASIAAYPNPLLPLAVINVYIALASATLSQSRWLASWQLGMALFVAHYATLWLRSEGNCNSTPGAAAAAGLARGITISKSAGPVSQGIKPVGGLEDWGAFNQTEYGVQLATMAKLVGMGGMYIW